MQILGAHPYFAKKFYHDIGINTAFMDNEDYKKLLREGVVDFYTFSYYMSTCITVDENSEQVKDL